jgi:hypothetical protein
MAKTIRVYKSGGVWVAKKDGASNALAVENTQRDCYLRAREIALNQGLTITVYYPNGGIKAVINPKNRGEEESNCFITTSCVKYFGLKDNCYELTTLRAFRDSYLLKSSEGRTLVNQYYEIAPVLVKQLESAIDRKKLFKNVFADIQASCRAIEEKKYARAEKIYKDAVIRLFNYFKTV